VVDFFFGAFLFGAGDGVDGGDGSATFLTETNMYNMFSPGGEAVLPRSIVCSLEEYATFFNKHCKFVSGNLKCWVTLIMKGVN